MAYETASIEPGRQQVWIVELHMRSCSLEFGVGACPATGTPCFNTEATCPVYGSFDETEKIYRFIEPVDNMPLKNGFIPSLKSVSITPGAIKVGGGLGTRAVASVSFYDHPHSDIGIDPYIADRDYDPFDQGTFWGKFRARNPYYLGNLVRIYHGYIINGNITSFNYDNAVAMDFYLESMSQPSSGTVTLVAKDPLKSADDKRAVAPMLNSGYMQSAITAAAGQVITLLPAGVGNLEYETSGTVIIAGECADFTRVGDAMTLTVRGVRGTTASAQDAESAVQQVLIYTANTAAEICQDLLETYADTDPDLIDADVWAAECDSYLPFLYDAFIVKPTPVKDLITALGSESPFDIFWNERRNQIEFKAVKSPPLDAPVWDDNTTFLDSDVSLADAPELRVSTVIINFDVINPAGDLDDPNNYRQTHIATDTDSVRRYGGQVIKTINSRFLSSTNRAAAEFAASVIIARFADVPLKLSADVDQKDVGVWTGDCVFVDHYKIQDSTGANAITPYQVTSVTQKGNSLDYQLITYGNIEDVTTEFLIILDGAYTDLRGADQMHLPPLTLRELFDRTFSVEPDTRTVRVRVGVNGIVGHRDNDYAIIINDSEWPATTPIIIEIEDGGTSGGYVTGKGGNGAVYGGDLFALAAEDGGNGIFTDRAITILNNGIIAAGGGGGGGSFKIDSTTDEVLYSEIGGGGAGYPAGNTLVGEFVGSLRCGSGGSGITPTTDPEDTNAELIVGGDGQSGLVGGGGGGGDTPGSGGTGWAGSGGNGTTTDGGDGGAYLNIGGNYLALGGGGGGALDGDGGDTQSLLAPVALHPYMAGGAAGIAINGIAFVTIDPLSTGVIIGTTV